MLRARPVQVHAEAQVPRRREEPRLELLLELDRVRAEVDVLPASHELFDEPADLRIHERLPARNAHDRRAALLHRPETLLHAELLSEDLGGVLDLPAARAREVAPKEGLEHQDERVAPAASELLPEHIRRHRPHLRGRNAHRGSIPLSGLFKRRAGRPVRQPPPGARPGQHNRTTRPRREKGASSGPGAGCTFERSSSRDRVTPVWW